MVQPFDYTTNIANPGAAFQQSYVQGMELRAVQEAQAAARAAAQQKAAEQQQLRAAMTEVATANSPMDFLGVMKRYPQFSDQLSKQFKTLDEVKQNALYSAGESALALLQPGADGTVDPANAVKLLNERATAFENSRMPDMAQQVRDVARMVQITPGARSAIGAFLASANPERFEKYGRAQKTIGEAEKVGQEAAAIAEKRPFDLRAATADAISKEIDAKFKPKVFLADLGLKGAQTEAQRAQTAASRATAAQANAAANQINAGIIPSEKRPEAENKMRTEYLTQTKPYQEIKSAYSRVLAAEQTPTGAIAKIFAFMKMQDPGSVVREGEYATAQNATGVPQRFINMYNKALNGDGLSIEQRNEIDSQAKKLYTQARTQEAVVRKGVQRIAKGYGLNPSNIFYEATESEPTAPTVAPTPSGDMPPQQAAIINRANAIVAQGRR
jgi:hypothetical protein